MSGSTMYRLADHVTCRSTNTELKMLFDRQRGVMYELNETASTIVGDLSESPRDFDQILVHLTAEFDGPEDEIQRDATTFLDEFVEAGLIVAE